MARFSQIEKYSNANNMETTENNTTATNQEKQGQSTQNENPKMVIEITRYKGIVDAFNRPRSLAKLIVVIALIIVIVFGGITGIALVIKNYYPYKTVNSNEYGATIIQNEDNEVIYWLFNSAELWANSGIHVKKGDIISVRASGAFHTAIHHLVEDADSNQMRDKWLNPVGGPNNSDPKDKSRSDFRISPSYPFNTMLMQVIPEGKFLKDTGYWKTDTNIVPYIDGKPKPVRNTNKTIDYNQSIYPDIYVIGSERDKITIRTDGVLHFTVNDIALTRRTIDLMKINTTQLQPGEFPTPTPKIVEDLLKDTVIYKGNNYKELLADLKKLKGYYDKIDTINRRVESINKVKDGIQNSEELDSLDRLIKYIESGEIAPLIREIRECYNELDYYLITNFVDAWFVDNAGSFLIVIERKKQQ